MSADATSKHSPGFNCERLKENLEDEGIRYVWDPGIPARYRTSLRATSVCFGKSLPKTEVDFATSMDVIFY